MRARRTWFCLILVALLLLSGSTETGTAVLPGTERDLAFDALFTRSGPGWTGGDGTYSVALPDGRTVWIFEDSFIGTVNPDRSRDPGPLVRNAFVVQDGATLTTLQSEGSAEPQTLLVPPEPDWWYWPVDGTVQGDELIVFLPTVRQVGAGSWGFDYAGRDDAAVFTLPDLSLARIVPVDSNPQIEYGVAILEDGDHVIIYGVEDVRRHKYVHAARARSGDVLGPWEYYDGRRWSSDPAQSARLLDGVSSQFSVVAYGGWYLLISQADGFGPEIYARRARSPVGPWSSAMLLYRTPESDHRRITYNAVAHPQFMTGDRLLISYNINADDFDDLFANADNYRPRFIRVPLGALLP